LFNKQTQKLISNEKIQDFFLLSLLLMIINSCSTTNDVVQNNRINKRKYTKGLNSHKKNKNVFIELTKKNNDQNLKLVSKTKVETKTNNSFFKSTAINEFNNSQNIGPLLTYNDNVIGTDELKNKEPNPLLLISNKVNTIKKSNNIINPIEAFKEKKSIVKKHRKNHALKKLLTKLNDEGKGTYILKLIGISLLFAITGLDIFLAVFSIAFDGLDGVAFLFFFSALILTLISVSTFKKFKENNPKKESVKKENSNGMILLKTLGILVGAFLLMAILFFEIIL
jgi:hypothetical protein